MSDSGGAFEISLTEQWTALEAMAAARLPARHLALLLAIARKSWGWRRRAEAVGSVELGKMTGIDAADVRKILRDLADRGIITRMGGSNGRRSVLEIVTDPTCWRVDRHTTRGTRAPGSRDTRASEPRGSGTSRPGALGPLNPGSQDPYSTRTTNENYQRDRGGGGEEPREKNPPHSPPARRRVAPVRLTVEQHNQRVAQELLDELCPTGEAGGCL